MKLFRNNLFFILFIFHSIIYFIFSFRLNYKKATCSISSISIPFGTGSPVMVYNARLGDENLKLTVLEKDQGFEYSVDGNLFYSDKETGELWYTNIKADDKNMESFRDAFSLCRRLNNENKETKEFENSIIYENIRLKSLPKHVSLRKNINLENIKDSDRKRNFESNDKAKSSSFLEIKMMQNIIDRQMEKDLDDLYREENQDSEAKQYKKLNNDAYIDNAKLQEQLKKENRKEKLITDLYAD